MLPSLSINCLATKSYQHTTTPPKTALGVGEKPFSYDLQAILNNSKNLANCIQKTDPRQLSQI